MLGDVIPLVMSYVLLNITTENFCSIIGGYFLQMVKYEVCCAVRKILPNDYFNTFMDYVH